jgi:hypothetical protein
VSCGGNCHCVVLKTEGDKKTLLALMCERAMQLIGNMLGRPLAFFPEANLEKLARSGWRGNRKRLPRRKKGTGGRGMRSALIFSFEQDCTEGFLIGRCEDDGCETCYACYFRIAGGWGVFARQRRMRREAFGKDRD